jgi:hypothetical protein
MSLAGAAFLALWNDFDPARDDEYNVWHTFEHVPERVGIAGILSGRRYIARERTERRYFTLYGLEGLAVLDGPGYKDVVDRPTEWSAAMRPSFRNFLRSPCTTVLSAGIGMGGAILTFRFGAAQAPDATVAAAALSPLLETSGVSAVHLGRVDTTAKFPLGNTPPSGYVLVVEGLARPELEAAGPRIADAVEERLGAVQPVAWEGYDLAFAIERSGLKSPVTGRQPPRPDLRQRSK